MDTLSLKTGRMTIPLVLDRINLKNLLRMVAVTADNDADMALCLPGGHTARSFPTPEGPALSVSFRSGQVDHRVDLVHPTDIDAYYKSLPDMLAALAEDIFGTGLPCYHQNVPKTMMAISRLGRPKGFLPGADIFRDLGRLAVTKTLAACLGKGFSPSCWLSLADPTPTFPDTDGLLPPFFLLNDDLTVKLDWTDIRTGMDAGDIVLVPEQAGDDLQTVARDILRDRATYGLDLRDDIVLFDAKGTEFWRMPDDCPMRFTDMAALLDR